MVAPTSIAQPRYVRSSTTAFDTASSAQCPNVCSILWNERNPATVMLPSSCGRLLRSTTYELTVQGSLSFQAATPTKLTTVGSSIVVRIFGVSLTEPSNCNGP